MKFGPEYARSLRRGQGPKGDVWHLDDVLVKIKGELHNLWRVADQDGDVIDMPIQKHQNVRAAKRLLWPTTPRNTPTIGPRSHINRPDDESVCCDASNQLHKRSGFLRFRGSSTTSSGWDGTHSGRRTTGCCVPVASKNGVWLGVPEQTQPLAPAGLPSSR